MDLGQLVRVGTWVGGNRTIVGVLIVLFLPPLSVAIEKGLNKQVLIAAVLQLCGHVPGVIYGMYVVTRE